MKPTNSPRLSWRASILGSQLAELLRRPGRLLMTGLAVLAAAFVVFGTVMAQQITTNTTIDRFRGTPEAVSLIVTADGTSSGISGAALRQIRALPGVAEAVGRLDGGVPIAGVSEQYLQLYADPGTGPLSRIELVEGRYPDGAREIAVNRQAAAELKLAPGARTTLLITDPEDADKTAEVTVLVTAVVKSTATAEQQSGGYATDTRLARIEGLTGYAGVDIRAKNGTSPDELSAQVRTVLDKTSSGASLKSGHAVRAQEARDAVGAFKEIFLLISVFLAVAVGAAALVATSAFRIVFAQRLRQLALLRAIGAGQRRLVAALAVEGALVGAVAGSFGVLAALGVGHLVPPAARSAGQDLSAPGFPVLYAVLVVAGTALVTVCSALAPAVAAAEVPPVRALGAAAVAASERRINHARLGAGCVCAAMAAGLVALLVGQLPGPGESGGIDHEFALMVTVVSAALAFVALIALGPLLVRPVLSTAGWPLHRLGTTGRLAVSGVGGQPRRAAAVSVVVALGVALVSGALVCVACLGGLAERRLATEAPTDFQATAESKGFAPGLLRRIAASPELTHVIGYRTLDVTSDATGQVIEVSDLNPQDLPTAEDIATVTGALGDLGPGRAIVAADLADSLGVKAGDTFTLPSGHAGTGGGIELTVAATLPAQGPLMADVVVPPAVLDRMGASAKANGILADAAHQGLAARANAQRVLQSTIREAAADPDDVTLTVLATGRDGNRDSLRTLSTIAVGLVGLTVLIAVVGVGATTGLTAIERTREFGLLRALGLGGNALRRTVTLEAALYGVLGGVLGLALGVPYALLLVRVVVTGAPLLLPAGQLLVVFGGLVVLTALAGLLPAGRATRITPMTALSDTE
ncbi:FtsX-like permease family protein [Streptomyces sp. NPDC002588]|uniref:ABC transporter permease n=1 Tax=Streptomyces sp. NPDC002588 TaxID=3154419 RepID=UPI0033307337